MRDLSQKNQNDTEITLPTLSKLKQNQITYSRINCYEFDINNFLL